jgi:hypothetical protein
MFNTQGIIMKIITVAALFITACGGLTGTGTPAKSFDYDLQGTWVSNDPTVYSGKLVIGSDRITITGYSENQTKPPPDGDDSKRPFKGFSKSIALKGYSEEGKILIEDSGQLQEGIPYIYQKDESYPPKKLSASPSAAELKNCRASKQ